MAFLTLRTLITLVVALVGIEFTTGLRRAAIVLVTEILRAIHND